MQHIVCYSGGHSSALVAIEVHRRYGNDGLVLLNHDIHPNVEHEDIKRFKRDVAEYIGVSITYANHSKWDEMDQFDVVVAAQAFKVGNGSALCTNRLKTDPFMKWLKKNAINKDGCVIYYGFDANETVRIQRRVGILGAQGYKTDYPLAFWNRTILSTEEVYIRPPMTYAAFNHANCIGCLKAGRQHWYIVYCTRPDIWEKAKSSEDEIGYSIIKGVYLEELEEKFARMKCAGIEATEKMHHNTFWSKAKKILGQVDKDEKPCECIF